MGKAIKQKTQAKILVVEDTSNSQSQKYTIKAEIPEFSKFETDYITWYKDSGDPPKEGALVIAELHPSNRKGKVAEKLGSKVVDGSEEAYDVYWEMVGVEPLNSGKPTGDNSKGHVRATSSDGNAVAWVDADLRWRAEQEMWFFKEAIKHVIEHGKLPEGSNLYPDIDSVIKEADKIGTYLAKQFATRLDNHLVTDAMESGAVVTEIVEPEPVTTEPADDLFPPDEEGKLPSGNLSPKIWESKDSLQDWIKSNAKREGAKWSIDQVRRVLNKAGYKSKKAIQEYLDKEGNTLEGLARFLDKELNW